MEKLATIQKREKLNEVYAVDEKGNGGANHEYVIRTFLRWMYSRFRSY